MSAGTTEILRLSNRLPRVEEAKKYLEYMGGSATVIAAGAAARTSKGGPIPLGRSGNGPRSSFRRSPSNKEARSLAGRNAFRGNWDILPNRRTWRNAYLLGSHKKLRNGVRGWRTVRSVPGVGAGECCAVMSLAPGVRLSRHAA